MSEKKIYRHGDFVPYEEFDDAYDAMSEKTDVVDNIIHNAYLELAHLVDPTVTDLWDQYIMSDVRNTMLWHLKEKGYNVPYPGLIMVGNDQDKNDTEIKGAIYSEYDNDDELFDSPHAEFMSDLDVADLIDEVNCVKATVNSMCETGELSLDDVDPIGDVWNWLEDDDSEVARRIRDVHTKESFNEIFGKIITMTLTSIFGKQ